MSIVNYVNILFCNNFQIVFFEMENNIKKQEGLSLPASVLRVHF